MEPRDAPSTPEWRPASRVSLGTLSTPTSSGIFSPPSQTTNSGTSAKHVSIQAIPTAIAEMEPISCPEIAPHEAVICERLTRDIALCETAAGNITASAPQRPPQQSSLNKMLHDTSTIIKFHAKWFAPAPLATLLNTALDVASRSSSTADLYAALNLIDTICTYSILPTLLPAVRFITYTYYQGSRSNRHKRLSQHAWAVAQHILDSHLSGQIAEVLLDIISHLENVRSKFKFSAAIGALMMIRHKILPEHDIQSPTLQSTLLLLGLRNATVGDNDIMREQITVMIAGMLRDDTTICEIAADGGLDVLLDLVRRCVGFSLDKTAIDHLFNNLALRLDLFEARHQPILAELFVEARKPLPEALSDQLLVPWQRALILQEDTVWTAGYRTLLSKLSDSTFYLAELDSFISTSVSAFFQSANFVSRRDFVYTLQNLIMDPGTAQPAVDILSRGIIRVFTYKTQKEKWEGQRNWLFPIICSIARHSLEATTLLLRLRADEAGNGYLETEADMNTDSRTVMATSNLYGLDSLSLESWVSTVHDMISNPPERWDVYNAVITSHAAQLRNHALWRNRSEHIRSLCHLLCDYLIEDRFVEPPAETGLAKSFIIGQLLQTLTTTISYHSCIPRSDIKSAVATIINVAGSREHSVSEHCIHALTICCYELPELMAGYMDKIINKMARMVTQRALAMYVLEFFAGLSRFSDLQNLLRRDDFKRIFGVCHSYLQSIRSTTALERKRTPTSEQSTGKSSTAEEMAQYVYALTHHVITFWYMALKPEDRHGLKDYISSCLKYKDSEGKEQVEDQGLVTIDLMDRVDAEEHINAPLENDFDEKDGRIITRNLIAGVLLITIETALRTGKTIITIRRPSGTARRTINSHVRHDSANSGDFAAQFTASVTVENDEQDYITVFPDDISGRTYGKVVIPRPSSALGSVSYIELPENDGSVDRAIASFDRTSALDSHKAGIIYIGEEQMTENEILCNTSGSPDYREFLEDMGSLRRLKGATFNTQGLDRHGDTDGEYTIVWNNDVTELVYHITTFMPYHVDDEQMTVINKKKHIGNDFVNIVFNNSGGEFRFDTFPSQFQLVYIVISPSERTSYLQAREITASREKKERFYNVRVLARPGYPNLSSASEVKVISGASLGGYVRNLALNACVFSSMWQAGEGEYPSSWRYRLREIRRLYEKYQAKW